MNESRPACPECGCVAFTRDDTLRPRPSVVWFLLFGWISLLGSHALRKQEVKCQACGNYYKIRTAGSFICLVLLIVLLVCFAIGAALHW